MNLKEFQKLGGKARQKSMTKAQRRELALKGVIARLAKKKLATGKKSPKKGIRAKGMEVIGADFAIMD